MESSCICFRIALEYFILVLEIAPERKPLSIGWYANIAMLTQSVGQQVAIGYILALVLLDPDISS